MAGLQDHCPYPAVHSRICTSFLCWIPKKVATEFLSISLPASFLQMYYISKFTRRYWFALPMFAIMLK